MDVTGRVSWNWGSKLDLSDIEQINDDKFKIRVHGNPDYFIYCNRALTERIKYIKHTIYTDPEKNNHAVIRKKGFNVPIWYLAGIVSGAIPDNDGPRFNDYFCIFLDGDRNNFHPNNIIHIKITKNIRAKIRPINKKYIENQMRGSIDETQEMLFNLMKDTLLDNAIIDSSLNDMWVQNPKGGEKPVENFQHKRKKRAS